MDMLFVRKLVTFASVFLFTLSAQAETETETQFNGVTKGAFAVSPSGAATYSIPIEVPPGIAGLQPELALSYNSQGGNGLLGMGWSLSGLSAITRCPKNYAQDGEIVGVKLEDTDRYCLNGQRLMVVNGMAYGTSGAEYRTEMDSFAKVTSYGTGYNNDGPAYFKVQTKAGRIIEFGNTSNSNVNVTIQSSGQQRTLLWAVNKISDTVGNNLTISYIEESSIGHFRVSRMDYGNGNLSVRFEYPRDLNPASGRSDQNIGYIAGATYSTPTMLSNVKTYRGENIVRDFRLNYAMGDATARYRISKITECVQNSTCKDLNYFHYTDIDTIFTFYGSQDRPESGWSSFKTLTGDVNGDGLTDIIWNSTGSPNRTYIGLSKGDGTFDMKPKQDRSESGWSSYKTLTGDVNGDGLTDIIWNSTGSSNRTYIGLSNGDGTFDMKPKQDRPGSGWSSYKTLTGDVNGDGVTDIIWNSTGTINRTYVGVPNEAGLPVDSMWKYVGINNLTKKINYQPMTNDSIYTKYNQSLYPVRDIQNAMYVVETVTADNGIGGQKTRNYHYEGAKVNLLGRGFLGFAKQTVTTAVNGLVTGIASTDFRQDYPYSGSVSHAEVRLSNGALVGQSDFLYDYLGTIGNGPIYPYQTSNTKKKHEIDGSLVSSTVTTTTLESTLYSDAYDRDTVNVDVKNAWGVTTHRTTSVNDFAAPNQNGNWLLGRMTKSVITANNFVDAIVTRESTFDYYYGSGLLKTEIREPGAEANDVESVYLKTAYIYDTFGHKKRVTVSGAVSAKNKIATRFTKTTYAYTNPAFPSVTVTNHLGEAEKRIYDARWGKLVSVAGPDDKAYNRATTFGYNAFGRKNLESRIDGTQTTWERYWCDAASQITCETGEVYYQREESSGEAPSTIFYDKLGRQIRSVTTGFNNATIAKDTDYDARMRVQRVSRNYLLGSGTRYWAVNTYDALSRVKTATAPDNSVSTTTYAGLKTSITRQRTGANGFTSLTSSQTRNPMGQVVKATDADYNETTYTYTPFGNPNITTDSANNQITMAYDIRGRKKSMNDPDLGHWKYEYDAIGNLRKQTDARLQSFVMTYDTLNRLTARRDQSLGQTSNWAYYSVTDTLTNRSVGRIKSVSRSADRYNETYQYDKLGRGSSAVTTQGGLRFVVNTDYYPNSSRVRNVTYPSSGTLGRAKVRSVYDNVGNLSKVVDGNDTSASPLAYWTAVIANVDGEVTWETLGNGLTTLRGFNPSTGRLKSISTGANSKIQDLEYGFDSVGNLEYRKDNNQILGVTGVTEAFYYDDLNRLETAKRNGSAYQTISYDSLGNIRGKSGVGNYAYNGTNGAGPHAVSSIGGAQLSYDANGNMVSGRGRTVNYTTFNKPSFIRKGTSNIRFTYNPENARYKKVTTTSAGTSTQYNIGKLFERLTKPNGIVEYKNYIFAGGAMVAIDTRRSIGTKETDYVHTDHIGSTDVITKSNGVVKERLSYDPFGKYRSGRWNDGALAQLISSITPRGFTGHEMLPEVGLIHMNGRVYDPDLGRFVSADPFIQFPYYSQSLNRYSYVLNNPLSNIDPTGFRTIFDKAGDGLRNTGDFLSENSTAIVALGKIYVGGQLMAAGVVICDGSGGAACPVGVAHFAAGFYLVGDGLCDLEVTCKIKIAAAENGVQYSTDLGGSGSSYDSEDSPVTGSGGNNDMGISSEEIPQNPYEAFFTADNTVEGGASGIDDQTEAVFSLYGMDREDPFSLSRQEDSVQVACGPLTGVCIQIVRAIISRWAGKAVTKKAVAGRITGYTRHGLNQAVGRNGGKGVKAKNMLDAVRNPKKIINGSDGATIYRGQRATVILNSSGRVITTYGRSRGSQIWSQGSSRLSGSGAAQRRANELGFSYSPRAIR